MSGIKIGVGVIITNSKGEALFCKRKSKHGKGLYSIPGGGADEGEKLQESAKREIYEETGLRLQKLTCLGITNNLKTFKKEGVHFISIIFYCNEYEGELVLMEPDKHEAWEWYDINNLPTPHFEASKLAINLYLNKGVLLIE